MLALGAVAENGWYEDAAFPADFHADDGVGECLGGFWTGLAAEETAAGIGCDGSGGVELAASDKREWFGEDSVFSQESGGTCGDGINLTEDAVKVDGDAVAGSDWRGFRALDGVVVFQGVDWALDGGCRRV